MPHMQWTLRGEQELPSEREEQSVRLGTRAIE